MSDPLPAPEPAPIPQKAESSIKPVHVDGFLWMFIGLDAAMLAGLNTDDAYKYCGAYLLFWMRWWLTSLNGAAMALKMYRSTAYAKSQSDAK